MLEAEDRQDTLQHIKRSTSWAISSLKSVIFGLVSHTISSLKSVIFGLVSHTKPSGSMEIAFVVGCLI